MAFDLWPPLKSAWDWFMHEMPAQTLAIVLTVILVPAIQGVYARYRFKSSRASLLGMLDKHFDLLQRGVGERNAVTIVAEAAILDELMRTVAATMRPEMIRKYDDYLRDLIRNQGSARDLKYLSAKLLDPFDDRDEQKAVSRDVRFSLEKWQEYFVAFRKHFQ